MLSISLFASLLPLGFLSAATAASGAETYKANCAQCHENGAAGAPRVGMPADWRERSSKGYAGLLRSASEGVHAKVRQPENDVAAALRYMLSSVNLAVDLAAANGTRST